MSGGRSFGASSLDQKMWLGQADPIWRSGIRRVFHHLPVDTGIRVGKGRLKSSSRRAAPLTAGPEPLRPEAALRCRTNSPESAGEHRQRPEDPRGRSRNGNEATAYIRPRSLGSK